MWHGRAPTVISGGVVTVSEPQAMEIASSASEVVRRQPDGSWRYIVDPPSAAAT
jgi:hypothetical protein